MTVVFDARQIREADRAEVVHETVAQGFSPVKIDFAADRGPVAANFMLTDFGDLSVCSSISTAVKLRRTAALARDDSTPSIFLALQMSGSSVMVQRDRQTVQRPGDLLVYDSTTPWVIADNDGIRQHKFRIPMDRMALPHAVIQQVCAVALCPGHPVAELAAAYFLRLATSQKAFDRPDGDVVSRPSIELLRAVISTHIDARGWAKESTHSTLFARIMDYVGSNLHEVDLTAERVAAAHYISVRYLYKVFAAENVSLSDWIRKRRLEECRRELAAGASEPVAVIARRWGFGNASSFSRMFHTEFGVSPREWRETNRRINATRAKPRRSTP